MNYKTTLFLIVMLAVVAAYFIFVERGTDTAYEREQQAAQVQQQPGQALFASDTLAADQVTRLTLARGDHTWVIEKDGSDWRQVEPIRFPLNSWSVQQIIDDAVALRSIEQFEPGQSNSPTLKDAALDPPQAVITLAAGESTHTIRLGKRTLGGHGYVIVDDQTQVHVVQDDLHRSVLNADPRQWRKKSIEAPPASRAQRLELTQGTQTISLIQHEGRWRLDTEDTQRADKEKVESLISSISTLYLDEFISDDPKDLALMGLEQPRVMVRLTAAKAQAPDADSEDSLQDQQAEGQGADSSAATQPAATQPAQPVERYTLRIGSPTDLKEEQFFATWSVGDEVSPVIFTISKSKVESLRKSVDDLRDPRMITSEPAEVQELLAVRQGLPDLHLIRSPQQGGIIFGGNGPGYDVDYSAATDLIDSLAKVEAVGYVPNFKPQGEPAVKLSLTLRGTGLTERVSIYPADDGSEYLTLRESESVAYRVPADAIKPLLEPLIVLRDKTVLDLKPDQITSVTLQRDDGARFVFTRSAPPATQPASTQDQQAGEWKLTGFDAFEEQAFKDLLTALTPLRAERWLTESAELPASAVELTVEVADASPRVLRVDAATRRARIDGVDAAFEIPASLLDKLTTEYRPRTLLPLTLDQVREVVLEEGGQTLTVRRDESDRYVNDAGDEVDQETAGKLFDTLAGLQAQRFITLSADAAPQTTRRITVKTRDGQTSYQLELLEAQGLERAAHLSDKTFSLSQSDWDALTASLAKSKTAAKK